MNLKKSFSHHGLFMIFYPMNNLLVLEFIKLIHSWILMKKLHQNIFQQKSNFSPWKPNEILKESKCIPILLLESF